MRTLAIRNGDLQLMGDRFAMVEGPARLQQQVGLCMREPWQIDRFHRGWGSVLPNWIGNVINTESVDMELSNEIRRVVRNFVVTITEQVKKRANAGLAPVVASNEVITDVDSIEIRHEQDQIYVRTTIATAGTAQFSILTTPGGA